MEDLESLGSRGKKRTIQQLPIPSREGHAAIFNSTYLEDIVHATKEWKLQRILLVHSRALDRNTTVVRTLKENLGSSIVGTKSGVGAHSPYEDVLEISRLLSKTRADCLISIGSSSYSDACKIARLMQANLAPQQLTIESMEALVDPEKCKAEGLGDPKIKLILVPTSLSASEWNHSSSTTNPNTHKKEHFVGDNAAPDLILLDPNVASTSPRKLWLSSGMRAVDHCVETMVNDKCTEEVFNHMKNALATLLKGLKDYKDGESQGNRSELMQGISQCQFGSRDAMMGLLLWRIPMGPSHAIGHQLGSKCGIMHGVTSCIMLAPVLRYTFSKSSKQREAQERVLRIWNETLEWERQSLADAVESFVKYLELPHTLKEVGVERQEDIEAVAANTLTDVFADQTKGKEQVLAILDMV
ncbi:Dehydroquinate synthase-like protein [Pyrenochaeta sp. DS3sAY3a]|nr:Dehydroquinate synthase-like protein [Pyrenochaeta sp. DS3sAY3a]